MSVADQLQRTLKKDAPDSEIDSGLSISVPDASMFLPGSEINSGHTQYGPQDVLPPPGEALPAPVSDQISLPLLGARPAAQHRRVLSAVFLLALLLLASLTFLGLRQSGQVAQQRDAAAAGQMQSQRLAKAVTQALVGNAKSFTEVSESSQVLVRSVRGLLDGDAESGLTAVDAVPRALLEPVEPLVGGPKKMPPVCWHRKKP